MAKKKAIDQNINQEKLSKKTYSLFDFTKSERPFLITVCILVSIAGLITPYTYAAMWFGFALAAYSAIANDSIQTIGTFIASNNKKPWYLLWLFMGLIWVGTVSYSWFFYAGDVTYQRLSVLWSGKGTGEFCVFTARCADRSFGNDPSPHAGVYYLPLAECLYL